MINQLSQSVFANSVERLFLILVLGFSAIFEEENEDEQEDENNTGIFQTRSQNRKRPSARKQPHLRKKQ